MVSQASSSDVVVFSKAQGGINSDWAGERIA